MLRFILVALLFTAGADAGPSRRHPFPKAWPAGSRTASISRPAGPSGSRSQCCPSSAAASPIPRTSVTFQDQFNVHVSIAAFPMDATQRWELSTRGLKDYLTYFFDTFVMSDFRQMFPNSRIESTSYAPDVMNGAYTIFTLLPGGSMFGDKGRGAGLR